MHHHIRIPVPSTDQTPATALPLLDAVHRQLGVVPNLMKTLAHSPAALEGYLSLNGALARDSLGAPTRERVALAVAAFNGCGYCLSAHSYLAAHLAKLDAGEIEANRLGRSSDPKAAAALRFATQVVAQRGKVSDGELVAVRDAGFSDAEILEIVAHVALNTLTNYVNEVAGTAIDFPVVRPLN